MSPPLGRSPRQHSALKQAQLRPGRDGVQGRSAVRVQRAGHLCPQTQGVRSGHRRQAAVVARHPANRGSVLEPDHELGVHRHRSANALDDPHEPLGPVAGGMRVRQAHHPLVALELVLEDQRARPVPTSPGARRRWAPAASGHAVRPLAGPRNRRPNRSEEGTADRSSRRARPARQSAGSQPGRGSDPHGTPAPATNRRVTWEPSQGPGVDPARRVLVPHGCERLAGQVRDARIGRGPVVSRYRPRA